MTAFLRHFLRLTDALRETTEFPQVPQKAGVQGGLQVHVPDRGVHAAREVFFFFSENLKWT